MFRDGRILFPTDFSHYALYALKYALAVAKKYNGCLHVAHVLDISLFSHGTGHGLALTKADLDKVEESMVEHGQSRLEHVCRIAEDAGVKAECHMARGKPAPEIVKLVSSLDCGLVVIATHGRTGFDHVVFGSVAEKVVRSSPVPVLSVKHPEHEFVRETEHGVDFDLKRILFPTDFSELSERALPYATSLCREFGASLVLLHANEIPVALPEFMPDTTVTVAPELEDSVKEALERMKAEVKGIPVESVARTGIAYREIEDVVRNNHIDLVVIPTHGRSGIGHALFGSVTEKVVRLARCPVLTVRPEGGAPDMA